MIPGRASTLESVHGNTCNTHKHTRFTQVRGPRVEVTPLLLPVSLCSGVSEVTRLLLELYHAHTHTQVSLEDEEALRESLGISGGKGEVPDVVPRAGGGEGLYIAPRHTGVLCYTVDDAHKTLYRGTKRTQDTVSRYKPPTSCVTGGAGSCTMSSTGPAQPRPVG